MRPSAERASRARHSCFRWSKIFDHVKGTLDDLTIYNRVLSDEEIYEELGIERENLALNKDVDVSGLEVSDGRFTADKAVTASSAAIPAYRSPELPMSSGCLSISEIFMRSANS